MQKVKVNKEQLKKIGSIIYVILWCFLIFFFSSQDGEASGASSSFVVGLVNWFLNLFITIDLTKYALATFIIRKLAHMFIYFMLFFLIYNLFKKLEIEKKAVLFSYLFCLIYAISDEIHQLFVNERSGQVTDVFIDMLGVIVASILLYLIGKIKKNKKKKESNQKKVAFLRNL